MGYDGLTQALKPKQFSRLAGRLENAVSIQDDDIICSEAASSLGEIDFRLDSKHKSFRVEKLASGCLGRQVDRLRMSGIGKAEHVSIGIVLRTEGRHEQISMVEIIEQSIVQAGHDLSDALLLLEEP